MMELLFIFLDSHVDWWGNAKRSASKTSGKTCCSWWSSIKSERFIVWRGGSVYIIEQLFCGGNQKQKYHHDWVSLTQSVFADHLAAKHLLSSENNESQIQTTWPCAKTDHMTSWVREIQPLCDQKTTGCNLLDHTHTHTHVIMYPKSKIMSRTYWVSNPGVNRR